MRGYVDGKFGPWEPATHPEGALYFYDEARVCLCLHHNATFVIVM